MQELSDYEYNSNLYEYVVEFLHRVSGIWMFYKNSTGNHSNKHRISYVSVTNEDFLRMCTLVS